jgi:hypothetical protein
MRIGGILWRDANAWSAAKPHPAKLFRFPPQGEQKFS